MEQTSLVKAKPLADRKLLVRAIADSFEKLDPRVMVRNPVMFVVEVGAVLTTIELVHDTLRHVGQFGFGLQITLWLWFTVLFANFAEAMAEVAARHRRIRCVKRERKPRRAGSARIARRKRCPARSCVPAISLSLQ